MKKISATHVTNRYSVRLNIKRSHKEPTPHAESILESEEFKTRVMPHARLMYAKAYAMMRDTDDAADVVQEALANLWQNRRRLATIDNLASYCALTARNIVLDRIRRDQRNLPIDDRVHDIHVYEDVSRRIEDEGELKAVLRLISRLPASQQHVLRLNAIDGCTCDEIASVTGYSITNVRQLLSRGRQRLRIMYDNLSKTHS